jgi:hypothetical protein
VAWCDLLTALLGKTLQNTYVVIDALDECLHENKELMGFIAELSERGIAKIVISSRNWPRIERGLKLANNFQMRLELKASPKAIDTSS